MVVAGGTIKAVCKAAEIPATAQRIDLSGLTLAPGLIDLQVNGGNGILFNNNPSVDTVKKIAAAHRAHGSTTILPTLISDDKEKIPAALDAVRKAGAAGLHIEGPFLNARRAGCHPPEKIQKADMDLLLGLDVRGAGKILLTLAPELFSADDIKKLCQKGFIVAAGHSMADDKTLGLAAQAGLRGITHLYNAMGGLSARQPGLSGAALDDDRLYCSVIADGMHIAPAMLRLAAKAKPEDKLFLVSDAMPPAAQHPPQDFMLFDKKITARDGGCFDESGNLAGSVATLFDCLCYMVQQVGTPLPRALTMASAVPAAFLGLGHHGVIQEGAAAHFIAFDNDMRLQHVFDGVFDGDGA